jgi:hypothetical protein
MVNLFRESLDVWGFRLSVHGCDNCSRWTIVAMTSTQFLQPAAGIRGGGILDQLMAPARLKIGRNMAMTIEPMTTPRKTIKAGSMREVRASTVVSISAS